MRRFALLVTFVLTIITSGCWQEVQEGTVEVKTMQGQVEKLLHPGNNGYHNIWGDEYFIVSLRSQTIPVTLTASTKDNAALSMVLNVTFRVKEDDASVLAYVRKFGLNNDYAPPYTIGPRDYARDKILAGQVNTETKNALVEYDAYSLLANQEAIQAKVTEKLKVILDQQLYLVLESVQIIGRPDFLDDRIEQAASAVVANQKLKEASQAGLEADKIEAERKQVQAATYANPALLEIKKLELQVEVAKAWAPHQGALVFGSASGLQIAGSK